MKRPAPYLAATGFTRPSELAALAARLRDRSPATWPVFAPRYAPRRLVAGVLVSAKTLRGEPTTNRRYPTRDGARRLVEQANALGFVAAVHYNTRATDAELEAELRALVRAVPRLRMLQLNVERPAVAPIRALRDAHPDVEIVLQLNAATRLPHRSAWAACAHYADVVDHVLLDVSRGEGRDLNLAEVVRDVIDDQSSFHDARVRLGVAGGLGPDARPILDALYARIGVERFDALSFDAESRLRVGALDADLALKQQDDLDEGLVSAWFECLAREPG
jgi:hypothetical protein